MAEPYIRKNANDLIRAADWNQIQIEAREDIEQHDHSGGEDGTPIGTAGLVDGAVTTAKLADGSVTAAKIADGSVTTAELANLSVSTDKVANAAITAAKLADGSVTAAKIADGSVTAAKLADGSVTTAELANLAVTTDKIADAAITAAKLAAGLTSDIGIAVSSAMQNGQNIPIPNGFTSAECIFTVAVTHIGSLEAGEVVKCGVDANGLVSAVPSGKVYVTGMALAKRGGW
jgi:hypothetical protein